MYARLPRLLATAPLLGAVLLVAGCRNPEQTARPPQPQPSSPALLVMGYGFTDSLLVTDLHSGQTLGAYLYDGWGPMPVHARLGTYGIQRDRVATRPWLAWLPQSIQRALSRSWLQLSPGYESASIVTRLDPRSGFRRLRSLGNRDVSALASSGPTGAVFLAGTHPVGPTGPYRPADLLRFDPATGALDLIAALETDAHPNARRMRAGGALGLAALQVKAMSVSASERWIAVWAGYHVTEAEVVGPGVPEVPEDEHQWGTWGTQPGQVLLVVDASAGRIVFEQRYEGLASETVPLTFAPSAHGEGAFVFVRRDAYRPLVVGDHPRTHVLRLSVDGLALDTVLSAGGFANRSLASTVVSVPSRHGVLAFLHAPERRSMEVEGIFIGDDGRERWRAPFPSSRVSALGDTLYTLGFGAPSTRSDPTPPALTLHRISADGKESAPPLPLPVRFRNPALLAFPADA